MDPNSQWVLFDLYKSAQRKNKKRHLHQKRKCLAVKHKHSDEILYSTDLNHENNGRRAMHLIKQVEPNSYIGLALNCLKGGIKFTKDGGDNSSEGDTQNYLRMLGIIYRGVPTLSGGGWICVVR